MLLFLAFGSRSVESQVLNKHWRLWRLSGFTGGAPRFLYFSCIWFGFRNSRSGFKARLQGVYLLFFCPLYHVFFKKIIRKKGCHLTCILIEGTFPSTNQHRCTFSCFKSPSTHMQDALENVFAQREKTFIVVRRDLRSCTCSWGMMYDL